MTTNLPTSRALRKLRRHLETQRAKPQGVSASSARARLSAVSTMLSALADSIVAEQTSCLAAEEHGVARTWDEVLSLVEGALDRVDGAREVLP